MANFGLEDLRLVDPRDGWPNEKARVAASGANFVIDGADASATLDAALMGLNWVCATTARQRDLAKPVLTPEQAVAEMRRRLAEGQRCGILFGPERNGLRPRRWPTPTRGDGAGQQQLCLSPSGAGCPADQLRMDEAVGSGLDWPGDDLQELQPACTAAAARVQDELLAFLNTSSVSWSTTAFSTSRSGRAWCRCAPCLPSGKRNRKSAPCAG